VRESARSAILARLRRAPSGLPRPVAPVSPAECLGPPADFAAFAATLAVQGVGFDLAGDVAAARAALAGVMARYEVKTAVAWDHPDIEVVGAPAMLQAAGVTLGDALSPGDRPCPALAAVDMGLTGVDYALAATGTLVLAAAPHQPRAVALVPRLHVALVAASRLLPDPAALFARLGRDPMPSALSLVSGISSTGDIEFVYVRGVHGPLAVHVIGLAWR
jgi:L-lactate dehydrogenase complex protein LldG